MGDKAAAAWTSFANKNLKVSRVSASSRAKAQNTNLPIPIPSEKPKGPIAPKTLPHAISRAAKSGATELGAEDRLGMALGVYGAAMEKVSAAPLHLSCCGMNRGHETYARQVGDARLSQDTLISDRFVTPWQATLSTSIGLAMKARANVKAARLELDTSRAT